MAALAMFLLLALLATGNLHHRAIVRMMRLVAMNRELREHQSRESDLIWEAFAVDIGVGD